MFGGKISEKETRLFGKLIRFCSTFIIIFQFCIVIVMGWGNGPAGDTFSDNPLEPKYGTHDWIAQHALDFLDPGEKSYIEANLDVFLLGTEIPDNDKLVGGLKDNSLHLLFYSSDKSVIYDGAARRALSEFDRVINYLNFEEEELAAKYAGVMSHYIADLSSYGHVMDSDTEWGAESKTHHSNLEEKIGKMTTSYSDKIFNSELTFDGELTDINAFDAAKKLAYTITFGDGEDIKNCTWMEENYDWNDPQFNASVKESINLAVNVLADVLYSISNQADPGTYERANHIVISEVYYDTTGIESVEEYVELYNPTDYTIDISKWRIETASRIFIIPDSLTIKPASHFTLANNGNNFLATYGISPDVGNLSTPLSNSEGILTLKDKNDQIIDSVEWEKPLDGWDIKTSSNGGKTIERVPVDIDTDTDSEWISNSLQSPMVQNDGSLADADLTLLAIGGGGVAVSAGIYTYYRKMKSKKKKIFVFRCPTCNVELFNKPIDQAIPTEKEIMDCINGHSVKVPKFQD
ncbi:MAG: lamin tail domain-containing protein [Candidatus Bathyarchaeota archaeon]|nr:MAG: lamin tail domain-containing protein [Candidatus Bathyarchaeota archaeon]